MGRGSWFAARRARVAASFPAEWTTLISTCQKGISSYWLRTALGPQVANFVERWTAEHEGVPPTWAEVADGLQLWQRLPRPPAPDTADAAVIDVWRTEPLRVAFEELRHARWIWYCERPRSLRAAEQWTWLSRGRQRAILPRPASTDDPARPAPRMDLRPSADGEFLPESVFLTTWVRTAPAGTAAQGSQRTEGA